MNADGTLGSGCTPPSGDTLPDGVWAVLIEDSGPGTLTVDLYCRYHLESEYVKDLERQCQIDHPELGEEGCVMWEGVGVNSNPKLRVLPVADDATVIAFSIGAEIPLDDPGRPDDWDYGRIWIDINDGLVTQVLQEGWA